jgi:enamine deaminase RidA (YjgF/YER057c/UK114 family)
MSNSFEDRLRELGYTLPPPPATASAAYVPSVRVGNMLYVSGQISQLSDELISGRVGQSLALEAAQRGAEFCALNLLASVAAAVDGEIERVSRVVRVGVYVAATPEFTQHSSVGDAVSGVLARVFGLQGRHARTSIGVSSLPRGAAVEADAVFELAGA